MDEQDIDSWYISSARVFRAMGFFERYVNLPDADLARLLKSAVTQEWDSPFPDQAIVDRQAADMFLLMADRSRVWFGDLERVYRGADAYVGLLHEWSAISRGAFMPGGITETWKGDTGPVVVEFTIHGRKQRFIHGSGDFIDMSILGLINGLIAPSGYAFEACDNLGMPDFILVLSKAEKARLMTERNWRFVRV